MEARELEYEERLKIYEQAKKKSFFLRWLRCKHKFMYLGLYKQHKLWFCEECGMEKFK